MPDKYQDLRVAIKRAPSRLWSLGPRILAREVGELIGGDGEYIELNAGSHSAFAIAVWRMMDDASSPEEEANASYIIAAQPIIVSSLLAERDALRIALCELVGVLQVRHHGRMPDEVQQAFDVGIAALSK